jgi:hypothetical protein
VGCVGLAACGSVQAKASDAGAVDGVLNDAATCFGTGVVRFCLESAPSQPLSVTAPTMIDTGDPAMCAHVTSGSSDCVIAATSISIGATLRATGAKPLVLLATGSISILPGGMIDVGSHRGASPETGAGADFAQCDAGTHPGFASFGGGGAGGSLVGSGGRGGASFSNSVGGMPGATTFVNELRGGCAGQDGAGPKAPGAAGHGGGAVFLIAGDTISVQGVINAAGEGGGGGGACGQATACGGGGGGSGGMVGFDAPHIGGSGLILASGGGGGQGSNDAQMSGGPGGDPSSTAGAAGGAGGADGTGGTGGAGSSRAGGAADGGVGITNQVDAGGGGGGGGGAGIVQAPSDATLGTNVSPAVTP